MQLSDRYLNLVQQQLKSCNALALVERLVVYVAQPRNNQAPSLQAVGEWPEKSCALPPVENDPELRLPSPVRRWYPLLEGEILLGALRVELPSSSDGWSEALDRQLQEIALALTHSLGLEIERSNLLGEINQQREQISLMVHQLRNPLAAIRTYAELLMRRLGPESRHKELVKGMLTEQAQLNSYILAIDQVGPPTQQISQETNFPLLLPPWVPRSELSAKTLLGPLIDRAAATASLQGREWIGPTSWPFWTDQGNENSDGSLAEIVANLLENAFRYSSQRTPIGLCFIEDGLFVWDGGPSINIEEKDKIFSRGFRGKSSSNLPGSGLGLPLARQLAKKLGGTLELIIPPAALDNSLPRQGNAFLFRFFEEEMPKAEG